jgi:protein transport protein SEC61 subunit gamma and related proteins
MNKMIESLKLFIMKSKRVWLVMKKPTRQEFELISKISAVGIVVLGVFGFILSIAMSYLF